MDLLRTLALRCVALILLGMLTACGGDSTSPTSDPANTVTPTDNSQPTWLTRHKGIASAFYDVLWDGNRYLAVSDGSGLYSSTDGLNWERVATNGFGGNFSIAYINGLYLSGGDWQTLYTSQDGINWNSHSLCQTTMGCFSGIYGLAGNTKGYVATGEDGLLYYSSDGTTWLAQDGLVGTFSSFWGAAASPDRFVVVGASNGAIYSDDGLTWTAASFGSATSPTFNDVMWDGTQFVAWGVADVYTSTDGISWNYKSSPYIAQLLWNGTQYENLDYGTTDLVNWTPLPRAGYFSDLDRWVMDMHYLPSTGQYLVAGGTVDGVGWIAASSDGNAWQMAMSSHAMVGATWAGDHFVAIDNTGVLFDSTDGINWSSDKIIKIALDYISEVYFSIAWSPLHSRYVAVSSARTAVSEDGMNWRDATNGSAGKRVKWLNNQFIGVVPFSGMLTSSSDGLGWSTHTVPSTVTYPNLEDVAWSDTLGLYATVGLDGTIYTSPDLQNWTEYTTIAPHGLRTIIWAGGQFVAAGDLGTVMTSSNGVDWVDRSGSFSTIYDLTYAAGRYYAISTQGKVYSSSDGRTWGEETSDNSIALNALATNGTRVIALGGQGVISTRR